MAIAGAIYAYPISNERRTLTEEENQAKLESLFGPSVRETVVLASTRWDYALDYREKVRRRKALSEVEKWKEVYLLDDTEDSAWGLLETLLKRYADGLIPQLQERSSRTVGGRPSSLGTLIPWFRRLFGKEL